MRPEALRRDLSVVVCSCVVGLLVAATPAAQAISFDLAADWSDLVNPNGAWSYEVGGVPAPAGTRTGDPWGTAQPIWGSGWVGWSRSNGTELFTHDWQGGDVFLHSSDGTTVTSVAWTSPSAGVIDVGGSLWLGRERGRGNHWEITLDGELLGEGVLLHGDPYDSGNPFTFGFSNLAVNAGDVLSLEFVKSSGQTYGEYAVVGLSVNLIPEPGTSLLLGLGLAGLALRRRLSA